MKVKDTLKRDIKFEDVIIEDGRLMDEEGDVIAQIIENLPNNTEYFNVAVTATMPSESDSE